MAKSLLNPLSWFGGGQSGSEKQLKAASAQEQRLGLQDLADFQSGTLPPGQQTWLDNLLKSMDTRVASTYANLGIPGSTAQAIDEGANAANVTKLKYDMLSKVADLGVSLLGESGGNYKGLIANALAQDQAMQQALGDLAQAFGQSAATDGGGAGADGLAGFSLSDTANASDALAFLG